MGYKYDFKYVRLTRRRHVAAPRTAAVGIGKHLAHGNQVAVETRRPLHLDEQQLLQPHIAMASPVGVASTREGRLRLRRPRPPASLDLLRFVLLAAPRAALFHDLAHASHGDRRSLPVLLIVFQKGQTTQLNRWS